MSSFLDRLLSSSRLFDLRFVLSGWCLPTGHPKESRAHHCPVSLCRKQTRSLGFSQAAQRAVAEGAPSIAHAQIH